MPLLKEFKSFAVKGNAFDLAVGVIIGAAFGKIVTSIVEDVIMPPIGVLLGGVDFSKLAIKVSEAGADGQPVLLKYGVFLNAIIAFLIVAFVVFLLVKSVSAMKRKEEVVAPVAIPNQEVLLAEIRDLLKAGKGAV